MDPFLQDVIPYHGGFLEIFIRLRHGVLHGNEIHQIRRFCIIESIWQRTKLGRRLGEELGTFVNSLHI